MKHQLFQIDAFTDKIFGGNPACVVPLTEWLPHDMLLKIAKENAVPETAFFVDKGDRVHLRWFTPDIEMDLCGHATLATSHALKSILDYPHDKIVYETASGELTVTVKDNMYYLNFPSRMPVAAELPQIIKQSLSIQPQEVYKARDYLLVYDKEQDIKDIEIDRQQFDKINLDPGGVIVTAKGEECDFVSRFFTSQSTILEDPVTGSAHCSLIPLWASRLGKEELEAMQLSDRMGKLHCQNSGDRVIIGGRAKTYSIGHLWTE